MARRTIVNVVVALMLCSSLSVAAIPDLICDEVKLLADDGAPGDAFGIRVALSEDVAVIGASGDDDNGNVSGSAYVFRDNGSWRPEAKLLADDGEDLDGFGFSLSVSGDAVLIGAPRDCDNGDEAGSAYVFRYDGSSWFQEAKLLADDGKAFDAFGYSVSLSGDLALVGARFDDEGRGETGSAYVFRFDGSEWAQEATLQPARGSFDTLFGTSVAIGGDTAVVGTPCGECNRDSGSAYVYRFDGARWMREAEVSVEDVSIHAHFGKSVALDGDTLLVGAPADDEKGSAHVFRFDPDAPERWIREGRLVAADGAEHDRFGGSVALSNDIALIGADGNDDNGESSGSAYVFKFDLGEWVPAIKLRPEDGGDGDFFGFGLAVAGETVAIGALHDDDNGRDSGSTYIFDLSCIPTCLRVPQWICDGDVDGDGQVNPVDSALVQSAFGRTDERSLCNYDLTCDGRINPVDAGVVQSLFGTCHSPRDVCP